MKKAEQDKLVSSLMECHDQAKELGFGILLLQAAEVIASMEPEPDHMTIYLCKDHGGYGFVSDCTRCRSERQSIEYVLGESTIEVNFPYADDNFPCADHDGAEIMNDSKVKEAMDVIKQAMIEDSPGEEGSCAHGWHCNIAAMCSDAVADAIKEADQINFNSPVYPDPYKVGNDAASRIMKLCFGVETKA